MAMEQIGHTAWIDTIHTCVAHKNHTIKFVEYKDEENQAALEVEFVGNWCIN